MTKNLIVPRSLMLVAVLGMVMPRATLAEAPATQPTKTMDVALQNGGLLLGQLVNRQGQPKAGVVVSLRQKGTELARMQTDDLGRFAAKGLRGGAYQLVTADGVRQVRVWSQATAPPTAVRGALLVEGKTVRGQYAETGEYYGDGGGGGRGIFNGGRIFGLNPWLVGVAIAAAIAIPVALDDDDAS